MTTRTRQGWPASARWPLLTRSGVSDSSGPVAAEAALGAAMTRTTMGRTRRTCRAKVVALGTCMARKCTYAGSPTKTLAFGRSAGGRRRGRPLRANRERDERDQPQRAGEEHGDLPAPMLGDAEGQRVVHAVQRDARIERSGALAQQAEREAEECQRQQEGGLRRPDVDCSQDQHGDNGRG